MSETEFHVREASISSTATSPRVKPAPKASKIPVPFQYTPSDDGTDENLLILLHGLGDTEIPFWKLGKSLKLPQTAVLALRAPEQIPYLYENAYQWYTSFDELGEMIERPNPTPALEVLSKTVDHLTKDCLWPVPRIHFFGFAQGGSVAAEFGLDWWKRQLQSSKSLTASSAQEGADQSPPPPLSFGTIVTVSGPLLSYPTLSKPCPTPLLIVHRPPPAETALPNGALNSFKKGYSHVVEAKLGSKPEGMPSSKQEWEPIMRFWSERLCRRQVDGLYEVMSGMSS